MTIATRAPPKSQTLKCTLFIRKSTCSSWLLIRQREAGYESAAEVNASLTSLSLNLHINIIYLFVYYAIVRKVHK